MENRIEIKNLARKEILNIQVYKPGRSISQIQREFRLKEVIKLASNENPLGPSPKAISAIKKNLSNLNRYPDGSCFHLKERLSKKLNLKSYNFIISNGSDEIINLILKAFLNKGEEVIISKPTFLIYKICSEISGAKIKFIPLKNFRYDLEAMKKAITKKTKIIFVANPDNPTGTYVNRKETDSFLKDLPSHLICYFDEAYYELVEARDFPQTLEYLNSKNVIISRSFSKSYGLAGLRCGYGIARKEFIEYLDRVREPFNVNYLAQVAALSALDDREFLEKTRKVIFEGKRFLYREFKRLNIDYIPSQGNFVLFKIKDSKKIYSELLERGIIVREMSQWGLNNFIRITIGKEEENIKFIEALKEVLR